MKNGFWILVACVLCFLAGWLLSPSGRWPSDGNVWRDTIQVFDTVRYDSVVPRDSLVVRYEVVRLPVAISSGDSPTQAGGVDTCTRPSDSAAVVIPVTQVHYREDAFEAWVSGYRPRLDSVRLYPESFLVRERRRPKRWVLSAGVSLGYNPFTRRLEPTLGVSFGYKLYEK